MRHLFVQELPGVFLDVSFIQVRGQAHQADLGEAEVRQLDVSHGGDEEAAERTGQGRSADTSVAVTRSRVRVSLVGFQVSVDDAVVVEILQRQDGLREVHPSHVDRQRSDVLQQRGAVAACRGRSPH